MAPRRAAVAASAALIALAVQVPPAPAAPPALAALNPKVMSYYPATGGWTTMWNRWDPVRYGADFARIAALGATSVRIIVPAATFGFPDPAEPYVSRLRELVGIAASRGLTVQLTLFDWFDATRYTDITGSEQWAGELLTPYAGDRRIAFVEVRNEIDASNPDALAWARQLIPYVRSVLLGAVPVTISVGAADPVGSVQQLKAALAGAEPDFYDVHYFTGGGDQAYWTLQAAQQAVAPVPLWVGEAGYPTSTQVTGYFDLPETESAQEAAQAHFLKEVAWAARLLGMPPPGIWTLDDFEPGTVPGDGSLPNDAEYHFGLFRTDGSAKPAAGVVRSIFGAAPPVAFNGGFEQGVSTATGGSLPAEWSAFGSANAQLAQASTGARSGTGDALVRSLDGALAQGTFFIAPIAGTPSPGARLADASVWVRAQLPGASVRLGVEWLDATGAVVASRTSHPRAPRRAWSELRLTAEPPAAARSVRIVLKVAGTRGCVWFDDVSFGWQ